MTDKKPIDVDARFNSELFRERLYDLRRQQNLTLQGLADRIGTSKGQIWDLENKDNLNPRISTICNLAAALRTTVLYLIGHPEEGEGERKDD